MAISDFIGSIWQPPSPGEIAAYDAVRVAWRLAGNAEIRAYRNPADDLATL